MDRGACGKKTAGRRVDGTYTSPYKAETSRLIINFVPCLVLE
jgi:hypothetical protein